MKLFKKINNFALPRWMLAVLSLVFLVRIPSLFEPFYYGDEMIYLTLGNGIRQGLTLYRDIHDNKTPFIYFLAAISGNIFWFRALLCLWMLVTIVLFWHLTTLLFPKKKTIQRNATIVFAVLTSLPTLEGQIANAEVFMIGFIILAFIFSVKKNASLKNFFLSGIFISIATLFKVPAVFDAGAILFLIVLYSKFSLNNIKKESLKIIAFLIGLSLPIIITFVWYHLRGALNDYITAAFLQNLGYVASQRTGSVINQAPFLVKNGPILIRGIIVAVGFFILFLLRKKLSLPFILAAAWLLTSLFSATLSERPYPHYLVQAIPSFSLLFGILLSIEAKEQALAVIPLLLTFVVPVYYKFWYYPSVPYFTRFVTLLQSNDKSEYLASFGENTLKNYTISKEIVLTTKREDPVFVWGDSAPIYALTGNLPPIKYIAKYHINDYSSVAQVVSQLNKKPPRLIVIMPGESVPNELFNLLKMHYLKLETVENASFWYNTSQ